MISVRDSESVASATVTSFRRQMYGLDAARPAPANKYKRWSDNEVSQLLIAVRKKKTTAEIALALGRENTSILTKLRLLAADYYAEGRTAEEIQQFTGLPERDVARLIKKLMTAADTVDKQAVTAAVASDEQSGATSATASSAAGAEGITPPAAAAGTAPSSDAAVATAPSADNTPICEPNPDNSVAEAISSELPGATLVHSDRSGNPTDPDIKTVLAGLLDIQKSVTLLNSKPTMRDLMAVINNIQASLSERC